jgi:shikimate dehydrogenase
VRAAVLGSPIAHSLSPVLHRAAYLALGLDWTYDAIEVPADGLPRFMTGLSADWGGLSLTMPLKEAVLPLLADRSELVELTGAANTVLPHPQGWYGENTDVHGLLAALEAAGVTDPGQCVILGGGATARSALAAVASMGCRMPTLVTRRPPTAALATAARLRLSPVLVDADRAELDGADLVISTLPPGAADRFAGRPLDVAALLDVAYDPWPSALAQACTGTVIPGSEMLLHQAGAQVHLMTGRPAPLSAMSGALAAALGGRGELPGSSPRPVRPKG